MFGDPRFVGSVGFGILTLGSDLQREPNTPFNKECTLNYRGLSSRCDLRYGICLS